MRSRLAGVRIAPELEYILNIAQNLIMTEEIAPKIHILHENE